MKFLLTVAAVIAVAVAGPTSRRGQMTPVIAGPAIVDAFEPAAIGPAMIDTFEPVAVGPAMIDFAVPEVDVSPVAIEYGPVSDSVTASLVQIIVNINQAAAESSPVGVAPVVVPEPVEVTPVQVVDDSPLNIIDVMPVVAPPTEIVDVMPVIISPVHVVDTAPIAVEPVLIGTPVLPSPAVVLPQELN